MSTILIDKHLESTPNSATNTAGVQLEGDLRAKLDRLKMDLFDGNMRKYPQFKQEFNDYIKPLCHPSQVSMALKFYLGPGARDEVRSNLCRIQKQIYIEYESVYTLKTMIFPYSRLR